MRTLRAHEREALLELLDGWPLPDGWRGRDFFRRYLEEDPEYLDENVWVAEDAGRLVSCVQIFPRRLHSTAGEVPAGGIGSVFTAPSHRGRALASRLLDAASRAMRDRGMEVSVLVAGRLRWYHGLGWRVWAPPAFRLRWRGGSPPEPSSWRAGAAARPDELEVVELVTATGRDESLLVQVRELSTRRRAAGIGCVALEASGWTASLRLAGNPGETFRVALDRAGRVVAFTRGCVLDRRHQVTEWGYEVGGGSALADLLADELPGRGSLALPPVPDADLFALLGRRGMRVEAQRGAAWMLRCLDAVAVARRLGLDPRAVADNDRARDEVLLERLFPRGRFGFWTADRF